MDISSEQDKREYDAAYWVVELLAAAEAGTQLSPVESQKLVAWAASAENRAEYVEMVRLHAALGELCPSLPRPSMPDIRLLRFPTSGVEED